MSNTLSAVTGCYAAATSASAATSSAVNAVMSASIATTSTAMAATSATISASMGYCTSVTVSPTIILGGNRVSGEVSILGSDAVIRTDKGDIRLDVLFDIVQEAEQILCRIRADMERIEEYPALQAAYDHYKLIDKLCQEDPTVSDR